MSTEVVRVTECESTEVVRVTETATPIRVTEGSRDAISVWGRQFDSTAPNGGEVFAWNAATSKWTPTDIDTLISATYVDAAGDTMTGDLVLDGADLLTSADGTGSIGANTTRFATAYFDALDATSLTGTLQTAAQPNVTTMEALALPWGQLTSVPSTFTPAAHTHPASEVTAGTFAVGAYSFAGSTLASLGTVTTMDLNGGTIDGTTVGASTPAAGAFTTGTFSSTLGVTGLLTASAGISIGVGTFAAGRAYATAVDGTIISAQTGSLYDLALVSVAGAYVFRVPTGTQNVQLPGTLSVTGTSTLTGNVGIGRAAGTPALAVEETTSGVAGLYLNNSHVSNPNGAQIDFSAASPNNAANYFIQMEDSTKVRATIWSNGGATFTGLLTASAGIGLTGTLTIGADVTLSRGAANRLDLGSGDSLRLTGSGVEIAITASDNGTGVGQKIFLARNSNAGTPAAALVGFSSNTGAENRVWADATGLLRIWDSGDPTNANDTAGTVVGDQTSDVRDKEVLRSYTSTAELLTDLVNIPLEEYRFKNDSRRGAKVIRGPVIHAKDRKTWWVMNGDHKDARAALDTAALWGAAIGSIQELTERTDRIESREARLEEALRIVLDRNPSMEGRTEAFEALAA